MKQFYFLILLAFISQAAFSSPITGILNNGAWNSNATWDKNRKPQNGDTIVIPAGKTILVNGAYALNDVYIKVYGNLRITGLFSNLNLNSNSGIIVHAGGKVQTTLDWLQYIFLGGETIFFAGEVNGPVQANGYSEGFEFFNPLPVKFVGFNLTKRADDVLVQWSTSEEVNAYMYELERSFDSRNWNVIAYISAIGNSQELNQYSYTDKNIKAPVVYYRIRQVDADGKFTYTDIKSIKQERMQSGSSVSIASMQQKVVLQFPQEIKGEVMVRFVNLGGQVMDQQIIKNPVGQVVLNSKLTGNHIIAVSNGKDMNVAKQVIL